jgi:6-phosphogluconolactonase
MPQVDSGTPGDTLVYVGTGGTDVYVFKLESDAGLTPLGSFAAGMGPSFLALTPQALYAVNESSNEVASFAPDGGELHRAPSAGMGPAHVSVAGPYVLVANYGSGDVGVFSSDLTQLDATNAGKNAHQILDVGGNIYVPCLGSDYVAQYTLDGGHLVPKTPATVATAAGAGPRHLDVHPNGRWAYLINETNSTMTALDVDAGTLAPKQTVSTLPAGFTGTNTGAEVKVSADGLSVYGSNRGDDSIVHFHIGADGTLTLVGHTKTGGVQPRSFGISPDGTLLIVANQMTGNLVAMRIDAQTGALTSLGEVAQVPTPEYVGFLRSP